MIKRPPDDAIGKEEVNYWELRLLFDQMDHHERHREQAEERRKNLINALEAILEDCWLVCPKCDISDEWEEYRCPDRDPHREFIKLQHAIADLLYEETGILYRKE